jgi:hypothetical protein
MTQPERTKANEEFRLASAVQPKLDEKPSPRRLILSLQALPEESTPRSLSFAEGNSVSHVGVAAAGLHVEAVLGTDQHEARSVPGFVGDQP